MQNVLFLAIVALLSITSCSSNGYFESYRKQVPFEEAQTKYQNVNVERHMQDYVSNDCKVSYYLYNEENITTKYTNGEQSKQYYKTERTLDVKYSSSSSVMQLDEMINITKTIDSITDKSNDVSKMLYQSGITEMYQCDLSTKEYVVHSNNSLGEYVGFVFYIIDSEVDSMMKRCYRYALNGICESFVTYVDGNVYTCEYERITKLDNFGSVVNQKVTVQNVFRNNCELFYFEMFEKVTKVKDDRTDYTEDYTYAKSEFKWEDCLLNRINLSNYNRVGSFID